MEEYELHKSRYTKNCLYEKAHNWSSVQDMDMKFLQEIDNFISYNFGTQRKVRFPEQVSQKNSITHPLVFLILQKTEPLYFADISCCTRPFELKFGEHLDDEIWNNFGIQLMS